MSRQLREYARKVERMRARQRAFFRDKSPSDFREAKVLEKEVDYLTVHILTGPSLFDDPLAEVDHRRGNILSTFAAATELTRTLYEHGRIDIGKQPILLELLEECHATVERLEVEAQRKTRPK